MIYFALGFLTGILTMVVGLALFVRSFVRWAASNGKRRTTVAIVPRDPTLN